MDNISVYDILADKDVTDQINTESKGFPGWSQVRIYHNGNFVGCIENGKIYMLNSFYRIEKKTLDKQYKHSL